MPDSIIYQKGLVQLSTWGSLNKGLIWDSKSVRWILRAVPSCVGVRSAHLGNQNYRVFQLFLRGKKTTRLSIQCLKDLDGPESAVPCLNFLPTQSTHSPTLAGRALSCHWITEHLLYLCLAKGISRVLLILEIRNTFLSQQCAVFDVSFSPKNKWESINHERREKERVRNCCHIYTW